MEASSSVVFACGRPTADMNMFDRIFLRNEGSLGSAITAYIYFFLQWLASNACFNFDIT